MNPETDTVACFGKIPSHGDFLRRRGEGALVKKLDDWIQQGLFSVKSRGGVPFQAPDVFRFMLRDSDNGEDLIGVIQPSQDRVGRRYPLIIGRQLHGSRDEAWPHVPHHWGRFLDAAARVAAEAAEGEMTPTDLDERVSALGHAHSASTQSEAVENAFRSTTFREMVERTWEYYEDTRKYLVLKNLIDLQNEALARGKGTAGRGLRFPAANGDENALARSSIVFWLTVAARLFAPELASPSFFWSENGRGGLYLFGGFPGQNAFAAMFAPSVSMLEPPIDLETQGREAGVAAVLALPPAYGDLLEDDGVTLADFVAQLDSH